jgi:hypothetical protein
MMIELMIVRLIISKLKMIQLSAVSASIYTIQSNNNR